jgi:hypothetical protein
MAIEGPTEESAIAKILRLSGCPDIQAAINRIDEAGMSLNTLDPENAREVLAVMASAKSWGAQAAPRPQIPTTKL